MGESIIDKLYGDNELLVKFLGEKGEISLRNNANAFFGLFGNDFKEFIMNVINSDDKLENSIKAFLELGQLRNQLVHSNFAIFPLEKTPDEIYGLYKDAKLFIETFPEKLYEYVKGLDRGIA